MAIAEHRGEPAVGTPEIEHGAGARGEVERLGDLGRREPGELVLAADVGLPARVVVGRFVELDVGAVAHERLELLPPRPVGRGVLDVSQ